MRIIQPPQRLTKVTLTRPDGTTVAVEVQTSSRRFYGDRSWKLATVTVVVWTDGIPLLVTFHRCRDDVFRSRRTIFKLGPLSVWVYNNDSLAW